jgi:hypothetical protein
MEYERPAIVERVAVAGPVIEGFIVGSRLLLTPFWRKQDTGDGPAPSAQ